MRWYRYIVCLVALCVQVSSWGQNLIEEKNLWDKDEAHADGRFRSKVFIYEPVARSTFMPAVIIMPGGSYTYLAINSEGHDVAMCFASKGYVAVVLRYRMGFFGARYPQQIEDYHKAMDYIKANASRLGIDTTRIGVMGFSAGGHLAGCAAMEEDPRYKPAFAAMIYPVVTMREPYVHHPSKEHLLRGNNSLEGKLSLEEHVTDDFPPVFLLHCFDDPIVNIKGSRDFARELQENGVNCMVEFHLKGGHGFGVRPSSKSEASGWPERFVEWLELTVFN